MATTERARLPEGRTPWDPANGLRIGALVGGVAGIIGAVLTSSGGLGLVIVGAAIGGAIGYRTEKRKQRLR